MERRIKTVCMIRKKPVRAQWSSFGAARIGKQARDARFATPDRVEHVGID